VLAIDDLQWADRPSSRAVLFALRRLRADKVLAVVSARAGALADPGWARFAGGDSRVTRIRLGGLSPADLIELATALGLGVLSQRGASRSAAQVTRGARPGKSAARRRRGPPQRRGHTRGGTCPGHMPGPQRSSRRVDRAPGGVHRIARRVCICTLVASLGVPRMVPSPHSKWLQSGSCRSLGSASVRVPSR
jgi:hypothetical protein